MPPDRRALQIAETRPWLERANEDVLAAERLLGGAEPMAGTAVFHCQQAAEKALKGFLSLAVAREIYEAILQRLPGEVRPT